MTGARFDADLVACAGLVERGDPERFAAAMAAPPSARHVLFPVYAFNVEVTRAPWVVQEAMLGEMRLQWWRDVLDEIAAGGTVRRHEVATPLARVLDPDGARLLNALVEARRWDLYSDAFEDEAHLDRYLQATSGNLLLAAARALGPVEAQTAQDAGYAAGLAAFLRAVPELEARGRVPLVDGRSEAVAALARSGLARLARARRGTVSHAARPAFLSAWLAGPILRQASRDPRRVAEGGLGVSEFSRRLRLAVAAATGRI